MLLTLSIKNYAIIDKLTIDFSDGLNVLTGETGAGKSIIVGALSLALGYRANTDAIRTGTDKITVQALFSLDYTEPKLQSIFDEFGIQAEDQTILLTREIYPNGRNICRVNDVIINVFTLKSISSFIVDIHGQHEHQKLLNPETHIDFLDAFAADSILDEKKTTRITYEQMKSAEKAVSLLIEKEKQARAKEFEVRENLKEINSLKLIPGEDEKLEQRKKVLANSEKLYELTDSVYTMLYAGDRNICDKLTEINKKLGSKLSSHKIRDLVFENTMAMMIVVVDKEWERVSIYIRDIDGYSQNDFDAFKPQSNGNNNAIADIFKSFTMGNAPSF